MADTDAANPRAPEPGKPGLSTDARWTVGTGFAIAALLLTLVGVMTQRIDDVKVGRGALNGVP